MNKATPRRVLVVETGSLLDEGIKSWLSQESSLQVVGINFAGDQAFVKDVIDEQPDVIVLFEGGPLTVGRVFELLTDVLHSAAYKVITVLLDTNTINIYEKKQFVATQSDDLISLIQYS